MDYIQKNKIEKVYFKTLYFGLFLNVFIPAILILVGLFLKSKGVGKNPISSIDIVLYILLAASIIEIFFIFFFKKYFFSKVEPDENSFLQMNLVVFSLALSPTIYGFVYFILGGELRWFLAFAVITLLCFRIFKPNLEKTEELFEKATRI
ncbi:MAG: hypothetical protein AMJ90_02395 [candidate division Zixibacteria bacterium SM23_73_2]|nr:MAG: hypothetical protein AMJ90_02395 [candidate division Zixibacteria bacterium SM23_73_2]